MTTRVAAAPGGTKRASQNVWERGALRFTDTTVGPWVTAGVVAAGTAYIALNNPHVPGALGYCPLRFHTGLFCPGCGGSRAVYDLAHGDVVGAMGMNPVFTLAVPVLAILWVRWLLFTRGRPTRAWNLPEWFYPALAGGLVAFAILRNTPMFAPYLAP